jgi:ABC-type iron transport system FetAB ATPase subunit
VECYDFLDVDGPSGTSHTVQLRTSATKLSPVAAWSGETEFSGSQYDDIKLALDTNEVSNITLTTGEYSQYLV